MSQTSPNPTPPDTDDTYRDAPDPAASSTKTRRSQWTGLEAEILDLIVRPKMLAAIAHLNDHDGVSAANVARFFNDRYKVPASPNTAGAWMKALGIKVSSRAYVTLPSNPTQSVIDRQLNEILNRHPATGGVDPTRPADPPMQFTGATVPNLGVDPSFGCSLDPTPPDHAQ